MGYSPVGVYAHGSTRHLRDGIHELVWSQGTIVVEPNIANPRVDTLTFRAWSVVHLNLVEPILGPRLS